MKTTIALLCLVAAVSAQRFRVTYNRGSNNDGRYTPDNSGAYNKNDGKYYPDDSGKYVHNDVKYKHIDDKYKHTADKFGNNGGNFGGSGGSGGFGPNSGNSGNSGNNRGAGQSLLSRPGSGSGSGSGFPSGIVQSLAGSGSGFPSGSGSAGSGLSSGGINSHIGSKFGSGISAAGGFGAPVSLQQGSAAGKYDNRNYGIIRKVEKVENDGYYYLYETENGILAEEEGKLANRGTDAEGMRAHGFFTYTGPDSIVYTVRYTADENGFIPEAAHLPTPPPIPASIQRALDYQRSVGTL